MQRVIFAQDEDARRACFVRRDEGRYAWIIPGLRGCQSVAGGRRGGVDISVSSGGSGGMPASMRDDDFSIRSPGIALTAKAAE